MDWQPENYWGRLKLMARKLSMDRRLKRFFDSSDLVQITLMKARRMKTAPPPDEDGRLRLLHVILANAARDERDRLLSDKRNLNLEVSLNAALAESSACLDRFLAAKGPSPAQDAERHEILAKVSGAVDQLPQDQREVIVRHYLQGETMNEIARDLRPGCTPKAAAMLLYRGMNAVRILLGVEEGGEP